MIDLALTVVLIVEIAAIAYVARRGASYLAMFLMVGLCVTAAAFAGRALGMLLSVLR